MKRVYKHPWAKFAAICLILSVVLVLKHRLATRFSEDYTNLSASLSHLPKRSESDNKGNGSTEHVLRLIEEIQSAYSPKSLTDSEHSLNLFENPHRRICNTGGQSSVEDLLCLKPLQFLPNFENPCWYTQQKLACLPYFQVTGVDKSGTSDLFSRICTHPDVLPNSGIYHKETQWWAERRYAYGGKHVSEAKKKKPIPFKDYLQYFDRAATTIQKVKNGTGFHNKVTGDGSPMDLWDLTWWPRIPQNFELMEPVVLTPHILRHVNPDVKLILIFRNPVERQYSDYWFIQNRIHNKSANTFHSAVLKAVDILHDCTRLHSLRWCLLNQAVKGQLSKSTRLNVGFYSIYLREWLKIFPKDQFLFLQTEDYSEHMSAQMRLVFNFLNLRDLTETEMNNLVQKSRFFETKAKRDAEPMLQETRRILHKLYDPFAIELAAMLNDNKFTWDVTVA